MINIILLGPPGVGKGTQAGLLVKQRAMTQLSTGDMLRATKDSGSALGNKVADILNSGALVSDEIVIALIKERLEAGEDTQGYIFDGFPRTLGQADALGALLDSVGQSLDYVIEMRVDDAILAERITGRFTCGACGAGYHDSFKSPKVAGVCDACGGADFVRREDDTPEALRTRLMAYYKETSPLIGYYHAKGVLHPVDGLGGIDEINANIAGILA